MTDPSLERRLAEASGADRAAVLRVMAEDAFDVMNWARRQGFKRDMQLDQVVAAFKKTLADADMTLVRALSAQHTGAGGNDGS